MFSWSASSKPKPTTSYPAARAVAAPPAAQSGGISHSDHLRSYLEDQTLKQSTRKVSRDDTTYDTVFQTKAGHALILRVNFPAPAASTVGAPPKPPGMILVGVRATHPWVDGRMRVTGYGPITSAQSWASSGLKLGKAVTAVVQHLQLNPPTVLEITDESLKKLQSSVPPPPQPSRGGGVRGPTPREPPLMDAPPTFEQASENGVEVAEATHMPIPAIPSRFTDVEEMSRKDMDELLTDTDKFRAFVEEMSDVKTLNELKESISKGNVEAAEATLKREDEIQTLHAELTDMQSKLKEAVDGYNKSHARYTALSAPPSRREVVKKLAAAKKEAFEESEELASEWVEAGSESDVDDFIKKFVERRGVHHARAAKIERLSASMA